MKQIEIGRREFLQAVLLAAGAAVVGCQGEGKVLESPEMAVAHPPEESPAEPGPWGSRPTRGSVTSTEVVNIEEIEELEATVPRASATPRPEVRETETQASFDRELVESMYEMDGGRKLEEVEVDPAIMEAVRGLVIRVSGDITDLIVRAIPVDNADKERYPDTLGLRWSETYAPRWPLIEARAAGIICFAYADSEILIDVQAAASLVRLQQRAADLNVPIYLGYAYRGRELQQWLYGQSLDEYGNSGAASPDSTEHLTGLAADWYISEVERQGPGDDFLSTANEFGWVNSVRPDDRPHYFYLDGVWSGLTRALLEAGIDPNDRHNSVMARVAVFQILMEQAEGHWADGDDRID